MVHTIKHIRRTQDALAEMTEKLIDEYDYLLPPGAVIRCVARTVQQLRAEGVPTSQLAVCSEPLARYALYVRVHSDS